MHTLRRDALGLTRKVLQILVVLNIVAAVVIAALLIASLVADPFVMQALGVREGNGRAELVLGMRAVMVLGIATTPLAHRVLSGLLAIVDTVGAGDPFVAENAARLKRIAWAVLGIEVLHLLVGAVGAAASAAGQPLDLDWSFSVAPWLAVLLIFVLARVFEQGTWMRDELEGTV